MFANVAIVAAQGRWWCPMCGGGGGMGGWMLLAWGFWLVVFVGIAVALSRMLGGRGGRTGDGEGSATPGPDRAEQILKERYARGEIDQSSYRRMLDDIHGAPHA
ncbi:MAG TPA: SHOCT domain-containing protein [Gemmatimonadaceae bacterium]|nr:SHOCT domain-containing protein [Gemmatimonadaceae bacterium]